ncbi:hypothetical protein DUNSADRAFT_8495 [Dunaliella salina]|uniref:Uncharacterized protein n=1 Tax=Dunaliella salina TaxID=3046 RepID=A0ABQ7GJD7_DUNSA|nr:hypothetical protein DUNSADRAFT_8495 [Dunaliella salina]|eukprot:KAF5834725.1 hypothetical protein DUNSADRAFT_8495 [Dunaliella salina]
MTWMSCVTCYVRPRAWQSWTSAITASWAMTR